GTRSRAPHARRIRSGKIRKECGPKSRRGCGMTRSVAACTPAVTVAGGLRSVVPVRTRAVGRLGLPPPPDHDDDDCDNAQKDCRTKIHVVLTPFTTESMR